MTRKRNLLRHTNFNGQKDSYAHVRVFLNEFVCLRECVRVCVLEFVWEREREREEGCVCVNENMRVGECACIRERTMSAHVYVCKRVLVHE